jgi:hypothetical protein
MTILLLLAILVGIQAAWFSQTKCTYRLTLLTLLFSVALTLLLMISLSTEFDNVRGSMLSHGFRHTISLNAFSAAFLTAPFLLRAKSEVMALATLAAAVALYFSFTVSLDMLVNFDRDNLTFPIASTSESPASVILVDTLLLAGWTSSVLLSRPGQRQTSWALISIVAIIFLFLHHSVFSFSLPSILASISDLLLFSSIVHLPSGVIYFCRSQRVLG